MDRTQSALSFPSHTPALPRRTAAVPPPTPADARGRERSLLNRRYAIGPALYAAPLWDLNQAEDRTCAQPCTVKRARRGSESEVLRLFLREVEILTKLAHRNIAAVKECNKDEQGAPYLVLEALSGRTLHALLRSAGRLSLQRTLEILSAAAAGLTHSHDHGIVHGGLQPSSIFLHVARGTERGLPAREEIKLLDFGLSRDLSASQPNGVGPRSEDGAPESISYRAPEALGGSRIQIDERSDQWALAAIAYRMLSGRPPFAAADLRQRVSDGARVPIGALLPELPACVADAIERGLSADRSARHASVMDLIRAMEGLPPLGRRQTPASEATVHGFRPDLIALCQESAAAPEAVPVAMEQEPTRPYPNESFVTQMLAPSQQTLRPIPVESSGGIGSIGSAGGVLSEAQKLGIMPAWLLGLTAALAALAAALTAQGLHRTQGRRFVHSGQSAIGVRPVMAAGLPSPRTTGAARPQLFTLPEVKPAVAVRSLGQEPASVPMSVLPVCVTAPAFGSRPPQQSRPPVVRRPRPAAPIPPLRLVEPLPTVGQETPAEGSSGTDASAETGRIRLVD